MRLKMNKKRCFIIIFYIFICLFSLIGCTRMRTVDKLSMIHVFGLDKEGDELIGTALYPDYTKDKTVEDIQYLKEKTVAGNLFYQEMGKHTSTPITLAKIRVLVLGKEYAESGIDDMVKRFIINPELGTRIQVVVSEDPAEETLKEFSKGNSLTLLELIEHNMTNKYLPETNLHYFLNHYYGEGMDPFVPVIKLDENKKVMVEGIAIFKGDKLKLSLNEEKTFIFSTLKDKKKEGLLKIEIEHEDKKGLVIVRGSKSKKNWRLVNGKYNQPELNLTLNLEWTIRQMPDWINISKESDIELLKKLVTDKVKEKVEDLFGILKENEVDPLGIGNIVRSKKRDWKEKEFYQTYPELPINVKVNLEIIHSELNINS